MSRADEDGFAARWSRRKREAREAPAAPEEEAPAPAEEKTDAEILAELELPDPDTLAPGDDFSAFMKKAVPARIRNRALRRLWTSNPALANLDMLVDYGEDFTDSAMVVEQMQTAYQVGRGFLDRVAKLDEEEPPAAPAETTTETETPEEIDSADSGGEASAEGDPTPHADAPAEKSETPEELASPRPRKTMRFTFDDGAA